MTSPADKFRTEIDEACARLLSRAADTRGLGVEEIAPRAAASVEKYLCRDGAQPQRNEVRAFLDEMRADELCLIVACERGDEKAWEDLVAGFDATVKSAARKLSSSPEDADDLAGSIWAELYGMRRDAGGTRKSKLAYYSGRGSLAGWLRAVVSQLAVDQFRKESRFVQVEEEREFENLAEDAAGRDGAQHASQVDDPEEIFTEKQTARDVSAALTKAMAELSPEDRLILKLYYFDDLRLKDIAAAFGYHEATASRKLARLHAEIRKTVETELRRSHGWNESEVKRHLADAAERLGLSIEKLVAVLIFAAVLQDFYM